MADETEFTSRCLRCGAEVLTSCPGCDFPIAGYWRQFAGSYDAPEFCGACGSPYPWLSRQGRIYLLQNILDDEQMDEAAKLHAREQLEALASPDLDEDEERRRWERFRKAAPTVWAGEQAQKIISTLIEASTRAMIDKYAP